MPVNQRTIESERDFLPLIQIPSTGSAVLKFSPLVVAVQELKCLIPKSKLARNLTVPHSPKPSRKIQRVPSLRTRYEPAHIKSTSLATETAPMLTRIGARRRPN